MAFASEFIQTSVNLFGLFEINPALLTFIMIAILFGGLNLLEYKKFW